MIFSDINLQKKSFDLRKSILSLGLMGKSSHIGSALSCIDLLAFLSYYQAPTIFDDSKEKDYFILSKGHASKAVYAILYDKQMLSKKDYESYYSDGSHLGDHISNKLAGVDVSTGSLGHGFSIGVGLALANRLSENKKETYVLLGDGECNEGSTWEAAAFAAKEKLSHLYVIVDYNKHQGFGRTDDITFFNIEEKFKAFGFEVFVLDGHNFNELKYAFDKARKSLKPSCIIANTIKGKGVSFMEDNNDWHYRSLNDETHKQALGELK